MILLGKKGAWNGNRGVGLEPNNGPDVMRNGKWRSVHTFGLGKDGVSMYLVEVAYRDGKKGLAWDLVKILSLIPKKGRKGQPSNRISAQMPMPGWI